MKSKLRAFLIVAAILSPLLASLPGCTQSDNPKMVEAPTPAPPKPEELALPKANGKSRDYDAIPKYKKAMEGLK
jgi:hypothetical protein